MNTSARLLAAVLVVAGLSAPTATHAQQDIRDEQATTLRPGDVLRISVWPNKDLSGEFTVEETGYAHLPMLGRVRVEGMPIDELRQKLREGYGEAMKNPVVTITPVFNVGVLGQVRSPGVYPVTPTNTLLDVISMAGGFAPQADRDQIRLVREGQTINFNAQRALEEGRGIGALKLQSGDRVMVPRESGGLTFGSIVGFVQTAATIGFLVDRALD